MDLDPIGKHCALQSCNALDFLPIQCSCLQWFCKLHILPDLHHCSSPQQHPSEASAGERPKCAFLGCSKFSLPSESTAVDLSDKGESCAPAKGGCPGCQLSYCVHHRHMDSHACTGLSVPGKDGDTKHAAARAIFAQKFTVPGASTTHTPVVARRRKDPPDDPRKRAQLQKVNLMKLRHRAIPGDPKDRRSAVPIDQRLHVAVCLEIIGQPANEVVLWFRKTMVAGRALDLMVQHFGISHATNTFYLKSSVTAGQALQNHLGLSEQLEDGSTVLLTDSLSEITLPP